MTVSTRRLRPMSTTTCLERIRLHPLRIARVAIIVGGRPEVIPVNYAIDVGHLVMRTDGGLLARRAEARAPVAIEIDDVNVAWREGWSVVIHSTLEAVTDPEECARLAALPLHPWAGGDRDHFVRVALTDITGREIL